MFLQFDFDPQEDLIEWTEKVSKLDDDEAYFEIHDWNRLTVSSHLEFKNIYLDFV
jgi:hypothetical protein